MKNQCCPRYRLFIGLVVSLLPEASSFCLLSSLSSLGSGGKKMTISLYGPREATVWTCCVMFSDFPSICFFYPPAHLPLKKGLLLNGAALSSSHSARFCGALKQHSLSAAVLLAKLHESPPGCKFNLMASSKWRLQGSSVVSQLGLRLADGPAKVHLWVTVQLSLRGHCDEEVDIWVTYSDRKLCAGQLFRKLKRSTNSVRSPELRVTLCRAIHFRSFAR